MKYPFDDKTALIHNNETKIQSSDEILYQHDIKILELNQRVCSLENIINKIQQKYPAFWNTI